jgi:hypothetical protein
MAKQVQMIDSVNVMLDEVVNSLREKNPHAAVTKQSLVAEMIIKAHRRECKK